MVKLPIGPQLRCMSNEQKYECDEVSVMLSSICSMSLLSFSLKLLLLSGLR